MFAQSVPLLPPPCVPAGGGWREGGREGGKARHCVRSLHNLSKFKSVEFEVCDGSSQYLGPQDAAVQVSFSLSLFTYHCCFRSFSVVLSVFFNTCFQSFYCVRNVCLYFDEA